MLSRVSIWDALMTLVERARNGLGVGRERPGGARVALLGTLAGQDLDRRGVEGEGRLALARKGEKAAARAEFEATLVRSDYVEAMTRLEPCCLCALYELGKALCDAGEYSEALKRFTSALLMAPPEAAQQLRLQSAWCMWRLGRADEAQQLYWQVLDDDALCWQALLDRSRMHLALGSWASALVDLQLVIGLGQQSAEVHTHSAQIRRNSAQFF